MPNFFLTHHHQRPFQTTFHHLKNATHTTYTKHLTPLVLQISNLTHTTIQSANKTPSRTVEPKNLYP